MGKREDAESKRKRPVSLGPAVCGSGNKRIDGEIKVRLYCRGQYGSAKGTQCQSSECFEACAFAQQLYQFCTMWKAGTGMHVCHIDTVYL